MFKNDPPLPPEPRIVTTSSGLAYQDYATGSGRFIGPGDVVTFKHSARLSDGTEFENTFAAGTEPLEIVLGEDEMIPGLLEGIISMRYGGRRKLIIPPDLAYGQEGRPPDIPPGATLTYFIEVVDLQPLIMGMDPSGLQYGDFTTGSGDFPEEGDTLVVNYTGWLTDGTKFDSSLDEGREPFEFVLGAGEVIQGWDIALASMKVGGKRRIVVPSNLAYGEAGRPPTIPQNATLIFVVELLEIKPAASD